MPARLNNNVHLKQIHHNMRIHFENAGTQIEKASSGMRVNRSSDDPAELALADRIDSEVKALVEGSRNVQQSILMLQVADGALGQITDIVQRMKTLATQAASSSYNQTDRSFINAEFQTLKDEIEHTAEFTTYNGINLLSAETEFAIQAGPFGSNNDVVRITIGDMRATGPELNLGPVSLETGQDVRAALDRLEEVHQKVVEERNHIAAFQNRLGLSATTTASIVDRMQGIEGEVRDADVAQTLSNLTRSQILTQTASSLALEADVDIKRILTLMQ